VVREAVVPRLAGLANVRVVDPLPYGELAAALAATRLVLTDSGGIQEEAPSFGVPVLVLRDETERTEGVEAGVAELVGCDPERIRRRAAALLDDAASAGAGAGTGGGPGAAANPYGDGRAAERAGDALRWFLGAGPRPPDFVPAAPAAGRLVPGAVG
jgi:UDP-N-acetylglucosamine 2-epimerase (non-hydrolysing)